MNSSTANLNILTVYNNARNISPLVSAAVSTVYNTQENNQQLTSSFSPFTIKYCHLIVYICIHKTSNNNCHSITYAYVQPQTNETRFRKILAKECSHDNTNYMDSTSAQCVYNEYYDWLPNCYCYKESKLATEGHLNIPLLLTAGKKAMVVSLGTTDSVHSSCMVFVNRSC